MENRTPDAWGMLWFLNSRQYAEYMAIFEDVEVLPDTFAKWQKRATQMYEELVRKGVVVFKVNASPDEFRAWCVAKGHRLNADGRMAFGSFKAYEKLLQSQPSNKDQ